MKKKLNIAFLLISLSLIAIVIFQLYWSVNAYRVNKKRFNADIDLAMQRAMDDCKKDYFDSIRHELVKLLSPPNTTIRLDTVHEADTVNETIRISLSNMAMKRVHKGGVFSESNTSFNLKKSEFNFYRKKIPHPATIPEIVAEASFYNPKVIGQLNMFFGVQITFPPSVTYAHGSKIVGDGIFAYPVNYRQIDSIKLTRYLVKELKGLNASSPFILHISTTSNAPVQLPANSNYSKTSEYSYIYHAWRIFKIVTTKDLFVTAVFTHVQYTVIRSMMISLLLSILLILLTMGCFAYVIRIILQQKKLADLKDNFINNMTHELKTPIATITVAIEGLQKFNALDNPEKTQRYLQTSRNELNRLNDLVTKVLNMATFENKDIDMVKVQVDLDELMAELIASEQAKSNKTINISYLNKNNVKYIYADKLHFRNMIANLLDNAVKYSGDPVTITITCYRDNHLLNISVKDNGMGISAANSAQVFEKFYRVPTGNVHNVKGTGLGLSYVKYIAEAHGGSVFVKSEVNAGAEFIVSLPLSNG